jgi:hypothetical protein
MMFFAPAQVSLCIGDPTYRLVGCIGVGCINWFAVSTGSRYQLVRCIGSFAVSARALYRLALDRLVAVSGPGCIGALAVSGPWLYRGLGCIGPLAVSAGSAVSAVPAVSS